MRHAMRQRDIVPLRAEITKASFVRIAPDAWEIHFWIGEGTQEYTVTMHHPSESIRTWKVLDNALGQAEEMFDLKEFTIVIKE
jgi:hypothetical protein